MKEYHDKGIDLYCMDCFDFMKQGGVDKNRVVLFTDPPYGIDYNPQWLSDMNIRKGSKPNKSNEKVIGDSKPMDLDWLFNFKQRLIWGFPYIYDKNATGWLVWDKQPQVDWRGMTTPCEIASTTLRKGYDLVHCMWAGFLRSTRAEEYRTKHPTQKPLKVIREPIRRYVKDEDIVIFDPFLGSGTTAVACKELNRKCIGVEISEEYFNIAVNRLKNLTPLLPLPLPDITKEE